MDMDLILCHSVISFSLKDHFMPHAVGCPEENIIIFWNPCAGRRAKRQFVSPEHEGCLPLALQPTEGGLWLGQLFLLSKGHIERYWVFPWGPHKLIGQNRQDKRNGYRIVMQTVTDAHFILLVSWLQPVVGHLETAVTTNRLNCSGQGFLHIANDGGSSSVLFPCRVAVFELQLLHTDSGLFAVCHCILSW